MQGQLKIKKGHVGISGPKAQDTCFTSFKVYIEAKHSMSGLFAPIVSSLGHHEIWALQSYTTNVLSLSVVPAPGKCVTPEPLEAALLSIRQAVDHC